MKLSKKVSARPALFLAAVLLWAGLAACQSGQTPPSGADGPPDDTPSPTPETAQDTPGQAGGETSSSGGQSSLMAQIRLISDRAEIWAIGEEYGYGGYGWAVTDLDGNGRLELIAAHMRGTGAFTTACFYEVDDTYTRLVPCEYPLDPEEAWADVITDSVDAYRSPDTGSTYYIFEDHAPYGSVEYPRVKLALWLDGGEVKTWPLALTRAVFTRPPDAYDSSLDVVITDWSGAVIDQQGYDTAAQRYFAGKEKLSAAFGWLDMPPHEIAGMDGQAREALLLRSYNGFSVEPAPPVTEGSAAQFPLLTLVGQDLRADLNGDGAAETVLVGTDRVTGWGNYGVSINHVDCSEKDLGFYFDNPDPDYFAITDLVAGDGMLELALPDDGPSNDPHTVFLRWDGSRLTSLGSVYGMLSKDDLTFDGKGAISSRMRLSVLQTWFAPAQWHIGADGMFEPAPQELYYPITYPDTPPVTTLRELAAYADMDLNSGRASLPAGTRLSLLATDNARWVLCARESGEELWLHLDEGGHKVELYDGSYSYGALDGLNMAD